MAITTSDIRKIIISPDVKHGNLIPITKLTPDGYVVAQFKDMSLNLRKPSVETHENGLIYLASALVNSGVVHTYQ